jgi:outer membrane protein assembly factor BamB
MQSTPGFPPVNFSHFTFFTHLTLLTLSPAFAGQFENLGTPVKATMIAATGAGVDENGDDALYFSCAQPGSRLFLLQANPRTGAARQWPAPVGEGAWAMAVAPDKRVYLGTWESGYLLRFDPKHPDKGVESLGKPSQSESYVWQLAFGEDGKLYGCTYPSAKLVRYDPSTGKSEDLGRLDQHEMYARWIASSTNGNVYVSIGTVHAQVVRFNPRTGESKPMWKDDARPAGTPTVFRGADGQVYASAANGNFLCDGDELKPVKALPARALPTLRDGSVLTEATVERGTIHYQLKRPAGESETKSAKFEGAGVKLFVVGTGPDGRIVGSTALPLDMFDFTPATRELRDLGNPTDVGGEIYSFATDAEQLYICAYPNSFLSVYEPQKPWHYGKTKDSNPRGIGPMGKGHLRPRAMVIGLDHRVFVGSLAPYGQTGGAMGIYDPQQDKVTENYPHLVTNQGISALCFDPGTKLLFGGSCIEPGGGATPLASQCVLFAWDVKIQQKVWGKVIVPSDRNTAAMTAANGNIFAVTTPSSTLIVIDPKTFRVISQTKVPFGHLHEISLAYYAPHKKIYGLAGQSIFSVDPETFSMTEVARNPAPMTCGFAITETGIYFGSGAELWRWKW